MFVNKHFIYLGCASSKSKCCYHAEPSAYYFYVKTNISIDFQICISVPLIKEVLMDMRYSGFRKFYQNQMNGLPIFFFQITRMSSKTMKLNFCIYLPSFHKVKTSQMCPINVVTLLFVCLFVFILSWFLSFLVKTKKIIQLEIWIER